MRNKGAVLTTSLDTHSLALPGMSALPQPSGVPIIQYSRRAIFAIWAAAALPMGLLAWVVVPAVAAGRGNASLARPLLVCLTMGLIWQFALVVGLVGYEQRSLKW